MHTITVMGLGSGSKRFLSKSMTDLLKSSDAVYLRTSIHPVVDELNELGVRYESFDSFYESCESFDDVYISIVDRLIEEASAGRHVIYLVPGHPCVGERTVARLRSCCEKVEIVSGVSFLDSCFVALNIDPLSGLLVIDGVRICDEQRNMVNPNVPTIVSQVYDNMIASDVKLILLEEYPDDHEVTVISAAEVEGQEKIQKIQLYELDRIPWLDHLTSVYVPKTEEPREHSKYPVDKLTGIMEELRSEKGCPWDIKQTMDSLKQYLLEETYEVIEAIESGDSEKHAEELGDLLLQIVFQAQIAKEKGAFDFNDIVEVICEKLIRRHPHVFAQAEAEDSDAVLRSWEIIKRGEKAEKEVASSIFDGMEIYLPALMKAVKVQSKASRVGFDWKEPLEASKKILEEVQELSTELAKSTGGNTEEEMGDLLFAIVNVARLMKIDPEEALRRSCDKFMKRFRYIETESAKNNNSVENMTLDEMEILWQEAKIKGI